MNADGRNVKEDEEKRDHADHLYQLVCNLRIRKYCFRKSTIGSEQAVNAAQPSHQSSAQSSNQVARKAAKSSPRRTAGKRGRKVKRDRSSEYRQALLRLEESVEWDRQ
eukprot:4626581-Pyramimonas_sp.AAC.1